MRPTLQSQPCLGPAQPGAVSRCPRRAVVALCVCRHPSAWSAPWRPLSGRRQSVGGKFHPMYRAQDCIWPGRRVAPERPLGLPWTTFVHATKCQWQTRRVVWTDCVTRTYENTEREECRRWHQHHAMANLFVDHAQRQRQRQRQPRAMRRICGKDATACRGERCPTRSRSWRISSAATLRAPTEHLHHL